MIQLRSANERFEYVYPEDPALDRENEAFNWDEYLRTGDRQHIPCKDGEQPTVFHLQRLSRKALFHVLSKDKELQALEAVAYGLKRVENLEVSGQPFALKFRQNSSKTETGERLADETLDAMLAIDLIGDLGYRIICLSRLSPLV